jgi:hypothetical protein
MKHNNRVQFRGRKKSVGAAETGRRRVGADGTGDISPRLVGSKFIFKSWIALLEITGVIFHIRP